MSTIRKINVSEIEGLNPFDQGISDAVMPAGTVVVYENNDEYVLRVHNGVTNGGVDLVKPFDRLENGEAMVSLTNQGELQLPQGGIIAETVITDNPAIVIVPDAESASESQALYIKGGAAIDYHLHLTTGDLTETSIFLGTDDHNVRTTTNGGVEINTYQYGDTPQQYTWTFGANGDLTLPEGGTIFTSIGSEIGSSSSGVVIPAGGTLIFEFGTDFTSTIIGDFGNGSGYIRVESVDNNFSQIPISTEFYNFLTTLTEGTQFTVNAVDGGTTYNTVVSFTNFAGSNPASTTRNDLYYTFVSGDTLPFSYGATELTLTFETNAFSFTNSAVTFPDGTVQTTAYVAPTTGNSVVNSQDPDTFITRNGMTIGITAEGILQATFDSVISIKGRVAINGGVSTVIGSPNGATQIGLAYAITSAVAADNHVVVTLVDASAHRVYRITAVIREQNVTPGTEFTTAYVIIEQLQ